MTPDQLAELYRFAFPNERPWSADEFATFQKDPVVQIYIADHGFALTRTVAGESELLSLAVHPDHQKRGIATALIQRWLDALSTTAEIAFLEVAADNLAALALYTRFGFSVQGKRVAYYSRTSGAAVDAFLMSCSNFDQANND